MRRALIAVGGTVAGLVAILNYKSGAAPTSLAAGQTPSSTTSSTDAATSLPERRAATATTAPRSAPVARTVDGSDVQNRFGDVQVRLVIDGNRITNVIALQLPTDHERSAQISSIAGPELRREVLAAQSANIDGVSGATYTSESYAQSVQSAIDRAGLTPGA